MRSSDLRSDVCSSDRGLEADLADLVLEQGAQGLDQLELQGVGQPTDVVVALDVGRAGAATRLDDVRVERALDEELDLLARGSGGIDDAACSRLERADQLAADDLALLLRVGDASESAEELGLRLHHLELHAGGLDEVALDLQGLALPEEPVVDEHARQAVAHRPVRKRVVSGKSVAVRVNFGGRGFLKKKKIIYL